MRKILSVVLSFGLLFQQSGLLYAAGEINLANYLSQAKSAMIQPDVFQPARLRYISYDIKSNDFKLLLDKGNPKLSNSLNSPNSSTLKLNPATQELFNYFLIGLSLPNDTFWVNLRPDAPENIIDPLLEKTDIGKIFLEADLQLKKDTASLTSPQNSEGKAYWDKLYKKAGELFGTENITIPTITRPWIVPNEVIVRETEDSAYIYKATLKVMLEADYLNGRGGSRTAPTPDQYAFSDPRLKELNEYSSQIIRETIIPKLTKEINSSKRYAKLRQVYYSLVLARWFKQKYSSVGSISAPEPQSTSSLANSYISLIDSGNLANLASPEPCDKQTYFQAYQKSFKDGEYNLKETVSTPFGQSIRSYISGGLGMGFPYKTVNSPVMGIKVNSSPVTNILTEQQATVASPLMLEKARKQWEKHVNQMGSFRVDKIRDSMKEKRLLDYKKSGDVLSFVFELYGDSVWTQTKFDAQSIVDIDITLTKNYLIKLFQDKFYTVIPGLPETVGMIKAYSNYKFLGHVLYKTILILNKEYKKVIKDPSSISHIRFSKDYDLDDYIEGLFDEMIKLGALFVEMRRKFIVVNRTGSAYEAYDFSDGRTKFFNIDRNGRDVEVYGHPEGMLRDEFSEIENILQNKKNPSISDKEIEKYRKFFSVSVASPLTEKQEKINDIIDSTRELFKTFGDDFKDMVFAKLPSSIADKVKSIIGEITMERMRDPDNSISNYVRIEYPNASKFFLELSDEEFRNLLQLICKTGIEYLLGEIPSDVSLEEINNDVKGGKIGDVASKLKKVFREEAPHRADMAHGCDLIEEIWKMAAGSPLTTEQEELIRYMRGILKTLGNNFDKDRIIPRLSYKILESAKSIIAKVIEVKKEYVVMGKPIKNLIKDLDSLSTSVNITFLKKIVGVDFNNEETGKFDQKAVAEILEDLRKRIEGVYNAIMSDKDNEEILSVMKIISSADRDIMLRYLLKEICKFGVIDLLENYPQATGDMYRDVVNDEIGDVAYKLKERFSRIGDDGKADAANSILEAWRSVSGSPLTPDESVNYVDEALRKLTNFYQWDNEKSSNVTLDDLIEAAKKAGESKLKPNAMEVTSEVEEWYELAEKLAKIKSEWSVYAGSPLTVQDAKNQMQGIVDNWEIKLRELFGKDKANEFYLENSHYRYMMPFQVYPRTIYTPEALFESISEVSKAVDVIPIGVNITTVFKKVNESIFQGGVANPKTDIADFISLSDKAVHSLNTLINRLTQEWLTELRKDYNNRGLMNSKEDEVAWDYIYRGDLGNALYKLRLIAQRAKIDGEIGWGDIYNLRGADEIRKLANALDDINKEIENNASAEYKLEDIDIAVKTLKEVGKYIERFLMERILDPSLYAGPAFSLVGIKEFLSVNYLVSVPRKIAEMYKMERRNKDRVDFSVIDEELEKWNILKSKAMGNIGIVIRGIEHKINAEFEELTKKKSSLDRQARIDRAKQEIRFELERKHFVKVCDIMIWLYKQNNNEAKIKEWSLFKGEIGPISIKLDAIPSYPVAKAGSPVVIKEILLKIAEAKNGLLTSINKDAEAIRLWNAWAEAVFKILDESNGRNFKYNLVAAKGALETIRYKYQEHINKNNGYISERLGHGATKGFSKRSGGILSAFDEMLNKLKEIEDSPSVSKISGSPLTLEIIDNEVKVKIGNIKYAIKMFPSEARKFIEQPRNNKFKEELEEIYQETDRKITQSREANNIIKASEAIREFYATVAGIQFQESSIALKVSKKLVELEEGESIINAVVKKMKDLIKADRMKFDINEDFAYMDSQIHNLIPNNLKFVAMLMKNSFTNLKPPDYAKYEEKWSRVMMELAIFDINEIGSPLTGSRSSRSEHPSGSSSLEQVNKIAAEVLGGIDLTDRMLKIKLERVGSFASSALVLPKINNVEALDLDKEFEQIQAMVSSSIRPSDTRILEFAAACYYRGEFDNRLEQVSSCIKAAHLADELWGRESSPVLRLATMLPDALYGG